MTKKEKEDRYSMWFAVTIGYFVPILGIILGLMMIGRRTPSGGYCTMLSLLSVILIFKLGYLVFDNLTLYFVIYAVLILVSIIVGEFILFESRRK